MSTPEALQHIAGPLLRWYETNARSLPWRDQPTPYRVWISEIMLQQTRVEAVKPYFERFINALPDLSALAAVEEENLLKLWEGLGYYNRARNLKKAAEKIMQQFHGQMPNTYESLLELPGIGPYTAGAIASIACGVTIPAVDGNVLRVVARLTANRDDISKETTKKLYAGWLKEILPAGRAGDFNQAMMELGATVCLPKTSAKCMDCPVQQLCGAYRSKIVDSLPLKSAKKTRRIEEKTVFILSWEGKYAVVKRPSKGLLSGLWELPNTDGKLTPAEAGQHLSFQGFKLNRLKPLENSKHVFTHVEWQMSGYFAKITACPVRQNLRWITPAELKNEIALPSAFAAYRKIIAANANDASTNSH